MISPIYVGLPPWYGQWLSWCKPVFWYSKHHTYSTLLKKKMKMKYYLHSLPSPHRTIKMDKMILKWKRKVHFKKVEKRIFITNNFKFDKSNTSCSVHFLHEVSYEPVLLGGGDGQHVVTNALTVGSSCVAELPASEQAITRLPKPTANLKCMIISNIQNKCHYFYSIY